MKKIVSTIYLSGRNAIKSISNRESAGESPISLVTKYQDYFCDLIIVFDLSGSEEEHMDALSTIEEICAYSDIPVWVAGNIKSADDIARLISAGCEKCVLNFAKQSNRYLAENLCDESNASHFACAITQTELIDEYRDLIEKTVSEIVLLREHSLYECFNTAPKPIIAPISDLPLDRFMDIMEKPNVSGIFGNFVLSNLNEILSIKNICFERGIDVNAFNPKIRWNDLTVNSDGLIPVVVQDYKNNEVLMVAYMNEKAFNNTITTGKMTYYSRSRKTQWVKGETSGHLQFVKCLYTDCDSDTLLAKVSQVGVACHTGARSCFFKEIV